MIRVWTRSQSDIEKKGKAYQLSCVEGNGVLRKPLKVLLLDASTQMEGLRQGPVAWRQGK